MPFHVDPGSLRQRLELEAPDETPDGGGGSERSWVAIATLWASVVPETPGPDVFAERPVGIVHHQVTLRADARVAPRRRFRDGDRLLVIEGTQDPDGRGRWIVCRCREMQS